MNWLFFLLLRLPPPRCLETPIWQHEKSVREAGYVQNFRCDGSWLEAKASAHVCLHVDSIVYGNTDVPINLFKLSRDPRTRTSITSSTVFFYYYYFSLSIPFEYVTSHLTLEPTFIVCSFMLRFVGTIRYRKRIYDGFVWKVGSSTVYLLMDVPSWRTSRTIERTGCSLFSVNGVVLCRP